MACKCTVLLTDDRNEGNNHAIVRCQLAEGHTGKHRRNFTKLGKRGKQSEVAIEWDRNINDSEDLMIMKPAGKDDTAADSAAL